MKVIEVYPMEVSPVAYDLINDFNDWMEQSSKTTYRFSEEEQQKLKTLVRIMENHLNNLIEYEYKKEDK